ncbi:MAG: hypothetical protein ABI251_04600 [Mycobacteriaceae bacterium]
MSYLVGMVAALSVVGALVVPATAVAATAAPQVSTRSEINGHVYVDGGLSLTNGYYTFPSFSPGTPGEDNVGPGGGSSDSLAVANYFTAQTDFAFQIADQAGHKTGYWVKGYAYNRFRLFGFYHDLQCTIYHGDPGAGGVEVPVSPYQCGTNGDGDQVWNLSFHISVAPATNVTDRNEQARLLTKACSNPANCAYAPTSISETAGAPPTPVGYMLVNRTTSPADQNVAWEKTTTTSNSIGIKIGTKFSFPGVELSVELSYGYTVTDSYKEGRSSKLTAKPGEEAWFELAPALKHVEGDYLVRSDGVLYRLPNTSFDFPDPTVLSRLTACSRPAPSGGSGITTAPRPVTHQKGTTCEDAAEVALGRDADLRASIVAPQTARPGATVRATVKVGNVGPADSGPARTWFLVPAGYTITDADGGTVFANIITFAADNLPGGQTSRHTVSLRAPDGPAIGLYGALTLGAAPDPNLFNNVAFGPALTW